MHPSIDSVEILLVLSWFGVVGIAALRRGRLGLTPLECVTYGLPVGIVVMSLLMLAAANLLGKLSVPLVLVSIAAVPFGAWRFPGVGRLRGSRSITHMGTTDGVLRGEDVDSANGVVGTVDFGDRQAVSRRLLTGRDVVRRNVPLLGLLLAVASYQAFFWSRVISYHDGALVTRQANVYADWGMHLGDVSSFLYGDNFPPTHPRLLGAPMSYHYLASFTAAAVAKLGFDPLVVMVTQSFLLMLCIIVGLYAFGLRVIGERFSAILIVPIFLLGGGLGWAPLVARLRYSVDDPWRVFHEQVFDRSLLRDRNYPLPNPEYVIQAQRGFLYGLPLALLVVTLLLMAVRLEHARQEPDDAEHGVRVLGPSGLPTNPAHPTSRRLFVAAGLAAGIVPIGHFSTVYSLALAIPFVALFSLVSWPPRHGRRLGVHLRPLITGWGMFGAIWVALTVPQVLWVYGGELGAGGSIRVQGWWLAGDDPWWFFWVKNLGMLIVLVPIALLARGVLDGVTRRFFLGFSAILVLVNIWVFLPWAWGNALFLQYWLLSASVLVAALLGKTWVRQRSEPLAHLGLSVILLTVIGLGLLVNVDMFTTHRMSVRLDAEGVALAERIRAETPPDAVFATGTQGSNPIAVLSGRQVVLGFRNYLRTQGLEFRQEERDLRTMLQFTTGAEELLERYRVDYVAISPWERAHLHANGAVYINRFPAAFMSDNWMVFAVSPRARQLIAAGQAPVTLGASTLRAFVPSDRESLDGTPPDLAWTEMPARVTPPAATSAGVRRTLAEMGAASTDRAPVGEPRIWSWSEEVDWIAALWQGQPMARFYTEDFFRREWVVTYEAEYGSWRWDPAGWKDTGDWRQLSDGRIGIVLYSPVPEHGMLVIVVEQGGVWLIDELIDVNVTL